MPSAKAGAQGADLAVTPELALVGYLPRDLLLSAGFVRRSWDALHKLARDARATCRRRSSACPSRIRRMRDGRSSTAAVLVRNGRVDHRFRKALLPTYDVFDEDRYFEPFHGAADSGARRPPAGHQHLRRRLERSRLLEAPPLSPRSDRRARARGRGQRSSTCRRRRLSAGKHQPPRGDAGQHGAQAPGAGRLRQSVRWKRRSGLRRPKLRVQRGRRSRSPGAARSTPTS